MLIDLYQIIQPSLTLLDGIVGMEGNGPGSGDPIQLELILASRDPLSLDQVVCDLLGISRKSLLTNRVAFEQGIGKDEIDVVGERLEEVRQLNNIALMEMRTLLYELRPSTLEDENLGNLLQELVKSVTARSKIPIEVKINGEYKFPTKIELGCYRIAQEALNNIIKHSSATKAGLVLEVLPEKLYMDITDNGRGFKNEKIASTNLGLTIMRERAKLMGASISIESAPGKGTRITVIYHKNKLKEASYKK
jgi:signal transduction histidine kinase